jgi:hypothetical protein
LVELRKAFLAKDNELLKTQSTALPHAPKRGVKKVSEQGIIFLDFCGGGGGGKNRPQKNPNAGEEEKKGTGGRVMPKFDQTFKIGKATYNLNYFTGEVLESKTRDVLSVSGSGGGGQIYQGSGNISGSSISSHSTRYDTLFLRDSSGKEKTFEFRNSGIKVRNGQIVTVIWAIKEGKESGDYIAIHNHNTNETIRLPEGEQIAFTGLSQRSALGGGFVGGCVLAFVLMRLAVAMMAPPRGEEGVAILIIMLIPLAVVPLTTILVIKRHKGASTSRSNLMSTVNKLLSQIKVKT